MLNARPASSASQPSSVCKVKKEIEMCTLEKRSNLFILTLTGTGEHRLNPTLIDAIQAALARVKAESTSLSSSSSTALITTAHGKFFSNGLDLSWARSSASTSHSRLRLMASKFRSLVADLISLPMPTIVAITGHASAAGFILALSHDYILMRKDRGFLYMSELDIGLKIPPWFVTLVKCKIGAPASRREVVLRAAKMTAKDAVDKGLIDSAHDSAEETVEAAVRLGIDLSGRNWNGQVYGEIRKVMMADVLDAVQVDETDSEASTVASRL